MGFVGNSKGFETLIAPSDTGGGTFISAINNKGQLAGFTFANGTRLYHGFIASPAALPTGTNANGAYTFNVIVIPNAPIFIDPDVAIGYHYAIGEGDPTFASVALPVGIGTNQYTLIVEHDCSRNGVRDRSGRDCRETFFLPGGQTFDFVAHGFVGSNRRACCRETQSMPGWRSFRRPCPSATPSSPC